MSKFFRSILCSVVVSLFCSQVQANNEYVSLMCSEQESSLFGYAVGAVGLASLAGFVTYSLLPRQRYTLDVSGIRDCRTGCQIAWSDVGSCQVFEEQSSMPRVRLLGHDGQTCMTINQRDVELPCDMIADLITINIVRSSEYSESQSLNSADTLYLNKRNRNANIVPVGICASLVAVIWASSILAYRGKNSLSQKGTLDLGEYTADTQGLTGPAEFFLSWKDLSSIQIQVRQGKVDGKKKTIISIPRNTGQSLTITVDNMKEKSRNILLQSLRQLAAGKEIIEGKLDECVATDSGIVIAERGLIPWHTIDNVAIKDITKKFQKKRKITITCIDGEKIEYVARRTDAKVDSLLAHITDLHDLKNPYEVETIDDALTITLLKKGASARRKRITISAKNFQGRIDACFKDAVYRETEETTDELLRCFALYYNNWVYYVDPESFAKAISGRDVAPEEIVSTVDKFVDALKDAKRAARKSSEFCSE